VAYPESSLLNLILHALQMNAKAPTLKTKIKMHKPMAPIRPLINSINAPSYKLAKHIQHKLKEFVALKYEFKSITSTTFADVSEFHLNTEHRFLTLDVKDLYVNVPIKKTLNIT
jgi:hypothetical protein